MKALVAVALMLVGNFTYADELDELFARKAPLTEVLPVIHADNDRRAQELQDLQRRALNYYKSASAYQQILNEGLNSDHKNYRKLTCDLLLETFPMYLLYNPRPRLSDALQLVQANDGFFVSELITLRKMLLSVYLSSQHFRIIFQEPLEPRSKSYKSEILELLSENFIGYLQRSPKPLLKDALSLIEPHASDFEEKELLLLMHALIIAYPEPANLPRILKSGLQSSNTNSKKATESLAQSIISSIIILEKADPSWFRWMGKLIKLGIKIPFGPELTKKLVQAYSQLLEGPASDEKLIALTAPFSDPDDLSLFITLRRRHIIARPQSREIMLADCYKFEGRITKNCLNLLGKFDEQRSIAAIYATLYDLRADGFHKTHRYKRYQDLLEDSIFSLLNNEVHTYFGTDPNNDIHDANLKIKKEIPSECPVCLEIIATKEMHVLDQCGHALCKNCLTEHIRAQMGDGRPILCGYRHCTIPLSSKDFTALKMQKAERQIRKLALFSKIAHIAGAHLCSNEHCPDAFIPQKRISSSHHYQCRTCYLIQCAQCGYRHEGMSCSKLQKNMKEDLRVNTKIIQNKHKLFKPCPQCKTIIEKDGGCDHMKCKKCDYYFDWRNGRRL
jgi:hypothetical protein